MIEFRRNILFALIPRERWDIDVKEFLIYRAAVIASSIRRAMGITYSCLLIFSSYDCFCIIVIVIETVCENSFLWVISKDSCITV